MIPILQRAARLIALRKPYSHWSLSAPSDRLSAAARPPGLNSRVFLSTGGSAPRSSGARHESRSSKVLVNTEVREHAQKVFGYHGTFAGPHGSLEALDPSHSPCVRRCVGWGRSCIPGSRAAVLDTTWPNCVKKVDRPKGAGQRCLLPSQLLEDSQCRAGTQSPSTTSARFPPAGALQIR